MNERTFHGSIERLRSAERVAMLEIDRVVSLSLEALNAGSVLDIGTGSGLFAEAFFKKGLQVSGVDLSQEMLEAARRYIPNGDFRLAPMENLPFSAGSFDLIFLGLVLHEADDLGLALKEVHRTARRRALILEWPYETSAFGPPLDHRLKAEIVEQKAVESGFTRVDTIRLAHLTLFRLEK